MSNSPQKMCNQCGSPLVETTKTSKQMGNSQFLLTVTTYRCTNDECQKQKDIKVAEAERVRQEREEKAKEKLLAKSAPVTPQPAVSK